MLDAIEIAYVIRDRRAELGLTQAQLAETAGVSKRCLWSLEVGQNPGVQFDKLISVLHALGLDLAICTADACEADPHTQKNAPADALPDPVADGGNGIIDAISILTGGAR